MKKNYSIQAFRERTENFTTYSLPELYDGEYFYTHDKLKDKIDENGHMRPFRGNTVVFPLAEHAQARMQMIQEQLLEECENMMAEMLHPSSCHLTLHDLVNEYNSFNVTYDVEQTREKTLEKLLGLKHQGIQQILLRSTRVFNMMNTSVVLGFEPVDDENCERLMKLYESFHEIVPLSYELTPHVTISYYKPGSYTKEEIAHLAKVFQNVNSIEKIELALSIEDLMYQEFSDMNHYWNVPNVNLINTAGERY